MTQESYPIAIFTYFSISGAQEMDPRAFLMTKISKVFSKNAHSIPCEKRGEEGPNCLSFFPPPKTAWFLFSTGYIERGIIHFR